MRFKEAIASNAGALLRFVPIAQWPASISRLTGVVTPRAVVPHAHRSSAGGANVKILFDLLERTKNIKGEIAECGVWRGRTLVAMGLYLRQHGSPKKVFGFDSFTGFDDSVKHDLSLGGEDVETKKVGGFNDTSYALVQRKLSAFRLDNVHLEAGYFEESLVRRKSETFSFVHLDCDIYESYAACLNFFYPRLSDGGIMLFDEYNDKGWPGANRAVDEFFAGRPEKPQSLTIDNFEKWMVVKGS
jgi:Macrocin-O-methyltransferase (TylF)